MTTKQQKKHNPPNLTIQKLIRDETYFVIDKTCLINYYNYFCFCKQNHEKILYVAKQNEN